MSTSTRTITTRTDTRLVEVTVTDTVAASPEVIWSILSDDFLHVSTWARGVNTSVANPKTPTGINGSPHGGRVCEVDGLGITDERITAYDAAQHTLSYSVAAQKKPFFVEALGSTWSVQPGVDANSAVATLTVEAHTKGLLGGFDWGPCEACFKRAHPHCCAVSPCAPKNSNPAQFFSPDVGRARPAPVYEACHVDGRCCFWNTVQPVDHDGW